MTTTQVQEKGQMPIVGESLGLNGKDYYTREEFMDELARQLGSLYGLNDIREAH